MIPSPSVVLISAGRVDVYRYLMNTWNGLPGNYRTRVHSNCLAAVKLRIREEGTTPAVPISTVPAVVDTALLDDFLHSEPPLQEPVLGSRTPRGRMPVDRGSESEDEELEDEHGGGVANDDAGSGDGEGDYDGEDDPEHQEDECEGEDFDVGEEFEDATQEE